jgi:hypothetical protein
VSANHAARVDNTSGSMGATLSTINQLAVEAERDPRTVELTLTRNGVQPIARLHSEKRPQPLYSRDEAKRILTEALREAAEKYAR